MDKKKAHLLVDVPVTLTIKVPYKRVKANKRTAPKDTVGQGTIGHLPEDIKLDKERFYSEIQYRLGKLQKKNKKVYKLTVDPEEFTQLINKPDIIQFIAKEKK